MSYLGPLSLIRWILKEYALKEFLSVMRICKLIPVNSLKTPELKGLGHAILGNFSTDQIVIELT